MPSILRRPELPGVIKQLLAAVPAKGSLEFRGVGSEVLFEPVDVHVIEEQVTMLKRSGQVVGQESPRIQRKDRRDT